MRITSTGTLTQAGIGSLAAAISLALFAQGTASGKGFLSGSSVVTTNAQASLSGGGSLTNEQLIDSIISQFSDDMPARFVSGVEYVDSPSTAAESTVNNQTELDAAIALGSNRRIVCNSGSYNFIAVQSGQTDLDIVCANDATFSSGIFIGHSSGGASHRIRVSGGTFAGGIRVDNSCTHLMFHNVRSDQNGVYLNENAGGAQDHIAFVLCTILTNSEGNYGILAGVTTHLWILGCYISNGWSDVAGVRLVQPQNVVMGRNWIFSSGNRAYRVHAGTVRGATLILTMDNIFVSDSDGAHNIWYGPNGGGPAHSNSITAVESHYDSYYSQQASSNNECFTLDHDQAGGMDDFIVTNFTGRSPNTVFDDGGHPTNYTEGPGIDLASYEAPPTNDRGADH